jgi:hypothetical protein
MPYSRKVLQLHPRARREHPGSAEGPGLRGLLNRASGTGRYRQGEAMELTASIAHFPSVGPEP